MSLSIPSATLILGAARLAQGVASRVGQAIGFEDVLHGADAPQQTESGEPSALSTQLVEAIRSRLFQSGLISMDGGPNQSLQLGVNQDGTLRVSGDHPRAAEIEALLASSPSIVETAGKLAQSGEVSEITIDLTSPSVQANIPVTPGMLKSFGG